MNELPNIAKAAVEKANIALAGKGAANDCKIVVGTYTNDFGSWSSPSAVAASIISDAESIICHKFYASKGALQADFDAAVEITEAFTAANS